MDSEQELVLRSQRKTVSTWVESLVGIPVPTASDYSFRSVLQDGSLLCQLMETLKPGSVPKVSDNCLNDSTNLQRVSDVENFFKAAESIGLPQESLFSVEDLMQSEWETSPKVVLCLFNLQRIADRLGLPNKQEQIKSAAVVSDQLDFPTILEGISGDGPNPPSGEMPGSGIGKLITSCTKILDEMRHQKATANVQQVDYSSFVHPTTPPIAAIPDHFSPGNGFTLVQSKLKEMISCVTNEQESRIRSDMNDREIFMKELEERVEQMNERLTNAQMQLDQNSGMMSRADIEVIQSSAGELAAQLEEYRKKNKELQDSLEAERAVKVQIEEKYIEMKSKVESLDGVHNKYKEIQSENRKLYNMVQDLRGNIRVFCRIRPLGTTGDTAENCIETGSDADMAVLSASDKAEKKKVFKFDKVFQMGATQEDVYSETQPLIRSVLDGYNVCIFAYGQTGSGKTHTMSGTNVQEYSGRGINYRALDDLFGIKADRSEEVDFDIHVQMLEIYNEMLRDLLISDSKKANKLDIRSTEKSGLNVPDAVQVQVECTEDVLDVMEKGSMNRACSGTKMNDRSSRSHSVLTVIVDGTSRVTGVRTHGCLHLVDLAGSERIARSEATGDRLEEAKHINKSLSALGDVMSALAAKSSHVPYRNSKLTQLLQDSLSGQAKAMMFMHIAPEASSRGETLSTAMFGSRVSQITLGQAQKNTESGKIFEARDAISKLRTSAQSKDDRIKELAKVVETERAAAKTAMSEKQRMEAELKTLRDELSLTQRTPRTTTRSMSSAGTAADRKPRAFPGRDHIDPPPRASRRTNSLNEHAKGDSSARSTLSRSSAVSGRTATTGRSSTLRSATRSASSKPSFASDSKTPANRPSTASATIKKSVSDKDATNSRNVLMPKNSRRPGTAGPQNPRRVALARTSATEGGHMGLLGSNFSGGPTMYSYIMDVLLIPF